MTNQPLAPLTQRPEWRALQDHYLALKDRHLRDLFAEDPTRGERLTAEGAGLFLDYAQNRVIDETVDALPASERQIVRRCEGVTSPRRGPRGGRRDRTP